MNATRALSAVLLVIIPSTAHAASLHLNSPTPDVFSVYLDGLTENGSFDTVVFNATPTGVTVDLKNGETLVQSRSSIYTLEDPQIPRTFTKLTTGAGRPAGDPFTYINRALDADPVEGGKGWTLQGVVINSTRLSFIGGTPGQMITTASEPGGRLFLANLNAPWVPEPTSAVLAAILIPFALAATRRRLGQSLRRRQLAR